MKRDGSMNNLMMAAGGIGVVLAAREFLARATEAELQGKVALVTGGSRGLGLALARELADEGCRLAICARDIDELDRASEELEGRGADVLAVRCDVAGKDDVERMIGVVRETYGQVDVLICNAGIIQVGQVSSMELEDFQQAMDIMYWGALYPILAVLPEMRERRAGRIAVVSSIGGKISVPRMLPYNGAKFAAIGLSEGLQAELSDDGITVTTIVPGLMRTGSYLNAYFSGDEEGRGALYRAFAPLSTLPILSVDAASAARMFVRAIKRGQAECIYPIQFSLVAKLHGLAPATTIRILGLAGDRLLPETGEGDMTVAGREIDRTIESTPWRMLTTLGRRAADRFREHPGPVSVPDPD
jgi:NAD(P)-dependent dehydrogenase (short-subunit alcohol dehydrogenase family)